MPDNDRDRNEIDVTQVMEWDGQDLAKAVHQSLPDPKPTGIMPLAQHVVGFYYQGENYRLMSQRLSKACSVYCERLEAEPGQMDVGSMLIGRLVHDWLVENVDGEGETRKALSEPNVLHEFMEVLEQAMDKVEAREPVEEDLDETVQGLGPVQDKLSIGDPSVPATPPVQLTLHSNQPAFVVIVPDAYDTRGLMARLQEIAPGSTVHRVV